jgi:RimJ/RimL family protein N-acetyltransferase
LHTWGTGVAQELHDDVLDRMRASGVELARLWVMAENHRGRRFYEKLGWADSGARSHSPFEPHPPMWELTKGLRKGA